MKVISIKKGEEIPVNLSGVKEFWLNEITKEDTSVISYRKPTFPSEFSSSSSMHCNYNYDGMTPTLTYNSETKLLKATGWGYETMTLTFN